MSGDNALAVVALIASVALISALFALFMLRRLAGEFLAFLTDYRADIIARMDEAIEREGES